MEVRKRFDANEEAGSDPSPDSSRIFGTMVDAGSDCYLQGARPAAPDRPLAA
jgi:hypothetical protein